MLPWWTTPPIPVKTPGATPHFTKAVMLGALKNPDGKYTKQYMCVKCVKCFDLDPKGDCPGIPEGFSIVEPVGIY